VAWRFCALRKIENKGDQQRCRGKREQQRIGPASLCEKVGEAARRRRLPNGESGRAPTLSFLARPRLVHELMHAAEHQRHDARHEQADDRARDDESDGPSDTAGAATAAACKRNDACSVRRKPT
jgi:hypothetical protein